MRTQDISRLFSSRHASIVLLTLMLLAGACSQNIRPLSIHDTRLPLDARRWIADSDDAVTVASAWREEALEKVEATKRWHAQNVTSVKWPSSPDAVAAESALAALSRQRLTLANLQLELAQAELDLAQTRRTQVNAETAVRYDLRSYYLEPLVDATRVARTRVETLVRQVAEQRLVVDDTSTEWWDAFQRYVNGGGDPRVLWLEEK